MHSLAIAVSILKGVLTFLICRVTPGNNYLESLAANNVTVECGQILKITSGGIEMEDGTSYIVDAIICATGESRA